MADKRILPAGALASQLAQALLGRAMLDYSLVYVDAQTGDINVLSYNEIGTCASAAAGIASVGGVILQSCAVAKVS